MFDGLKRNIVQEKKIIVDIRSIYGRMKNDMRNQRFYLQSINSLMKQIYLLNRAVPDLLKEWSPVLGTANNLPTQPRSQQLPSQVPGALVTKPLPQIPQIQRNPKTVLPQTNTVNVSYVTPKKKEKHLITLDKKDRKEYLKSLHLSEKGLLHLNKGQKRAEKEVSGGRKVNPYARISNKYFRKYSDKIASRFDDIGNDLKKANLPFLLSTYLSMAMFSAVLVFFGGLLIYFVLIILNPSLWIHIWIPIVTTGLVLGGFYLYPSSEAGSVQKKIVYELPFASIHMAAIAGSDIEPTKIFKIIANSPEYPNIGNEMRKVLVQTEIYGYDLVESLKNVASRTSSKDLGELFSGLATNISTGGQLKNFLEKKAENYLLDYKLERQKYSDLAGTFMDVYISILIAAPLVLMMMVIVMGAVPDMKIMDPILLVFLAIGGIALANIAFLFVLNIKQPKV